MKDRWRIPVVPTVIYELPLRMHPTVMVRLLLPVDLTPADVERLCGIIRILGREPSG